MRSEDMHRPSPGILGCYACRFWEIFREYQDVEVQLRTEDHRLGRCLRFPPYARSGMPKDLGMTNKASRADLAIAGTAWPATFGSEWYGEWQRDD
jgi:hypothetical protein